MKLTVLVRLILLRLILIHMRATLHNWSSEEEGRMLRVAFHWLINLVLASIVLLIAFYIGYYLLTLSSRSEVL